jgi:hypothetical protein
VNDQELLRRLQALLDKLDTATTALQHGQIEEGTVAALQATTLVFALTQELEAAARARG